MSTRTKLLLVLAAALLIGGVWFLRTGRSEIKFNRVTPEQASKAAELLSRDQDNDGLKDWEEELWHTDPLKQDSDGDGTSDGEEIKLGRDPNKAGPGDTLDKETIESKTVPGGGDWTETDRISRELFAKYLSIKQSNGAFTAADEEKLLQDFVGRYPEYRPSHTLTINDLAKASDDDTGAWHVYGNAVGKTIREHQKKSSENEMIIFERALENEDEVDLANLKTRVELYEALLENLKVIPVPKSLENMGLALMNAIEGLKENVSGMAAAFSDPVHALSASAAYPKSVDKLFDASNALKAFFTEQKITFGKDEAGKILTE